MYEGICIFRAFWRFQSYILAWWLEGVIEAFGFTWQTLLNWLVRSFVCRHSRKWYKLADCWANHRVWKYQKHLCQGLRVTTGSLQMNEMYFCPFSAPTVSHCPSNWTFLVQIVFLCYLGLFWICTKEGKHFQVHFSCFRYKYFTPQPFIWGAAHFLLFLGDWAIGL